MLFIYHQSSGDLVGPDGRHLCVGYSGQPPHVNDPAFEQVHNIGPIPRGDYLIDEICEGTHMGPLAIKLVPFVTTETYGRDGFYLHGDSKERPGFASHGCPIADHDARVVVAAHIGATLRVV